MSNSLNLKILLSAVDKVSTPFRSIQKQAQRLSEQLNQNELAYQKLSHQQKLIDNFKKVKYSIIQNSEALDQAKNKAQALANQLNATAQPTKKLKRQFEQAKKAVQALKLKQQEHRVQLQHARHALNQAGINTHRLTQAQRELRRQMDSANQSIQQQREKLARLNQAQRAKSHYQKRVKRINEFSDRASAIGTRAIAAGIGVGNIVSRPIQDFMSFEDVMAGVARQVQGLKDENGNFTAEYDVWKEKIQSLSKELPLTTNQIGEMVTEAARMDIPKEEIEDFIRLNTQMATAFDATNPAELVEQFGKVSKNFKLSAQGSKELADAINYLDDNAISKGTDIIGYMNRVAGIASVAKISEKNVAALGSTLLTLGAREEDASTAVNTIFTRLSIAGNHKEVDKGLGVLRLDPRKIAKGMTQDAQKTLMMVIEKIKKLPEQKRVAVMKNLVGQEHIKTMTKLVGNTEEWVRQIELANSEQAKGSMAREFQTRMTTLSAQWQKFQNQIFNTNSTIGAAFKETLIATMDSISGVLERIQQWVEANPELTAQLIKWGSILTASLVTLGVLSLVLSFIFSPILRFAFAIVRAGSVLTFFTKENSKTIKSLLSWRTSIAGVKSGLGIFSQLGKKALALLMNFRNPLNILKFGLSLLTKGFGILRLAIMPIGLLFSPIGLAIGAIIAGGALLVKHWETVKAFFGGFWEELKAGLAPVLEKFKPLGDLFGVVVDWIKQAVDWIGQFFTPAETSSKSLKEAADWGKKFGEWTAKAIELALTPLTLLMDGIKWVIDNVDKISWDGIKSGAKELGNKVKGYASEKVTQAGNFISEKWQSTKNFFGFGESSTSNVPNVQKYTGGYTGNGNKFAPAGIVHRGEYVMTKEATARLGVANLNHLNYGKVAGLSALTAGLATNVALADPMEIKVDNRPPITMMAQRQSSRQAVGSPINITINANANQSPQDIARLVTQEMQKLERQRQARSRSRLGDRD
ncbi:phage tail tape measure protein [Pasteurellaceae bacterium Macca]|nr:phage tail tape measure protein [Pasteurellaceae bacterium Macca]